MRLEAEKEKLESLELKKKARGLKKEGSRVGGDPEPSSSMIPLFNEDQLKRMDQMYSQAPLLQRQEPAVERPVWMQAEDERLMRMREERERERQEVTRAAMLREYPPGQSCRGFTPWRSRMRKRRRTMRRLEGPMKNYAERGLRW